MKKDLRKLKRHAEARGWRVEDCRRHLRWIPPEGEFVTSSRTPSDPRALLNLRADLRRAGLEGV